MYYLQSWIKREREKEREREIERERERERKSYIFKVYILQRSELSKVELERESISGRLANQTLSKGSPAATHTFGNFFMQDCEFTAPGKTIITA